MGLKVFYTTCPQEYADFLASVPNLRVVNVTSINGTLVLTYYEHIQARRHVVLIGRFDDQKAAIFHEKLRDMKNYISNAEITIIGVGNQAVYKVTGHPVEGSNWETFIQLLGLTKV